MAARHVSAAAASAFCCPGSDEDAATGVQSRAANALAKNSVT